MTRTLLLSFTTLLLSGCMAEPQQAPGDEQPQVDEQPPIGEQPLQETRWVLRAYVTPVGVEQYPETYINARFTKDSLFAGESPCVDYQFDYTQDGTSLLFDPPQAVVRCDHEAINDGYLSQMQQVVSFAQTATQLTLERGDGSKILFEKAAGGCDNALPIVGEDSGSGVVRIQSAATDTHDLIHALEATHPDFVLQPSDACDSRWFTAKVNANSLRALQCRTDVSALEHNDE